ncbi:surface protein 1 [Xylaria nigripes]|nr:surface protein 1 [Xylaria nigripes]
MQLTNALFALFSTSAVAATTSAFEDKIWTFENMTRTCDGKDTSCTWTFGINDNDPNGTIRQCIYTVEATASAPASQSYGGPGMCAAYIITSAWSGQFGPGQGFTIMAVIDNANQLIVYAGYRDSNVKDGAVVKPDLSFPVVKLM